MANNVYIGNRYVPVFADPVEWDNLRQYEPLTIVTYQGTAYTSRKTVPVGTALSNTDYWVVTGNYNAQVEQYRQEVVDLSDRVEILEDDILVTIGDSYLEGYTHEGTITGWGSLLAGLMGISSANHKSSAVGGHGLKNNEYATQLTGVVNNLTSEQKSKVKWVIVGGSYNDGGQSYVSMQKGLNAVKTIVDNNLPNAKLYAIPFGWQVKPLIPQQYDTNRTDTQVTQAIIGWFNACKELGVLTCDEVYSVLFKNSCFSNDYYHPNATGQKYLASAIYNQIFGAGVGISSVYNEYLQNVSAYQGTLNYNAQFAHWVQGKITVVNYWDGNVSYKPTEAFNISCTGSQKRQIGTYADAGFVVNNESVKIPVNCIAKLTGGEFYDVPGAMLMFTDNKIYVHFGAAINLTHNNFLNVNSVAELMITGRMSRIAIPNIYT